jgi:hypothetical protein
LNSDAPTEGLVGTLLVLFGASVVIFLAIFATPFALVLGLGFAGWYRWKNSPTRLEHQSYQHTLHLYEKVLAEASYKMDDDELERRLAYHLPGNTPPSVVTQLVEIGTAIFRSENIASEVPPPPAICNSIQGARYRDMLARISQASIDPEMSHRATDLIAQSLGAIAERSPREDTDEHGQVETHIPIGYFITDLPDCVADVLIPYFGDKDYGLFKPLKQTLEHNLNETGKTPIYPREYKDDDVVEVYLRNTPLEELFDIEVPFIITDHKRSEHHFIVGGTGHGKTVALQHYIAKDIEKAKEGTASVVVIDSQGDLIREIRQLQGLNYSNTVIIDPEDIHFPCSLNLFDVKMDRINAYDGLARERQLNGILELYEFVLGSLLSAEMTQKQNVIFRYVARLMLHIPDATLHTMLDLFSDGGDERYKQYIEKLDPTAQNFFRQEFESGREFHQTKSQVRRRLYGILENQSFNRMFTHPRSKLDLFAEMNKGKLILINTAKSLLKEEGTEIFGRFFIALITQAAQEREEIPKHKRMKTFVFIDEASDYRFDDKIDLILTQARKYNVGLTMATQYLDKISPKLQSAIAANTSIKFAGGVNHKDAGRLAPDMRCDTQFIADMPELTFAAYVKGYTPRAVPLTFKPGVLERLPQASEEAQTALRDAMRAAYAAPANPEADTTPPPPEGALEPPQEPDGILEPPQQRPPIGFDPEKTTKKPPKTDPDVFIVGPDGETLVPDDDDIEPL